MSGKTERGTLFQIVADPAVRVAIGAVFVMMLGYGIVAPILPLYARSFEVGYEAAGLLISMFAVARLVFDVVSGPMVDRYGERTVATAGLGVLLVSSLLTGLAPNFPLAVLFRSVGGAGSSAVFASMYSYLLKVVPKQQMGRTLGLFYGALNIGIIAGGPLGGFIAQQLGLAAPLFFYSGLMAPAGFLVWRYLRLTPREGRGADAAEERVPLRARLGALLRTKGFTTALVVNLTYAWMIAGVYDTLVPLFGREELGLSTVGIGVVLAPAAMLSDVVPEGSSGTAIGMFRFCGDLGFILGPLVAGVVASGWGFQASFAVAAVPSFVAFLFTVRTPETYRHATRAGGTRPEPTPPGTG